MANKPTKQDFLFNARNKDFLYPVAPPERPTVGREEVIDELLDVPFKSRMKNLVLVGPAGCGKTQLIREIASRLKDQYTFFELSVSGAVAGMKFVGDFERRIRTTLRGLPKNSIVFIDEMHTICGAGSKLCDRRELDLANMLKPYLSDPNSNFALWGATTPEEYVNSIVPDRALERRLPAFFLPPMSREETREILLQMADSLRKKIPAKNAHMLVDRVMELTNSLDAGIDLLDRTFARIHRTGNIIDPGSLLKKYIQTLPEATQ